VEHAIASLGQTTGPAPRAEISRPVLLAITSENGFVGGFNTRIMEQVRDLRVPEETLVVIGRRGQMLAREMDVRPDVELPMTSRVNSVTQLARRVAKRLNGVTQVRLICAEHQQSGTYSVEHRKVLPLDPVAVNGNAAEPPLHHLTVTELLDRLAAEFLFAEIARSLMASLLCEQNARLLTMDAASRNIDARFDKLRSEERRARQDQTTSDMLDVIVGSEAVNNGLHWSR
jgi:F-type H+-transporting ATPase subunit gamma